MRKRVGHQRNVDVLENLARSDAQHTIDGFDQVIAFASGVETAENVGEGETGVELFGLDQEAGAVGDPRIGCSHECCPLCLGSSVENFRCLMKCDECR